MNKKAVVDTLKEAGRIALFAAASALVAWGLERLGVQNQTDIVVIAGTIILRLIDKFLHKDDSIKLNGLAPF